MLCQFGDRFRGFRVHYIIIPSAAYRYDVHIGCGLRERNGRPARIRSGRERIFFFLSLFLTSTRFRYTRASEFPLRQIVAI